MHLRTSSRPRESCTPAREAALVRALLGIGRGEERLPVLDSALPAKLGVIRTGHQLVLTGRHVDRVITDGPVGDRY